MVEFEAAAGLAQDVLHDGETEAAGRFLSENLSGGGGEAFGGESDAIVTDFESVAVVNGLSADVDCVAGAGGLEGVGEEFEEDTFEGTLVEGGASGGEVDGEIRGALGGFGALAAGGRDAVGPTGAGVAVGVVPKFGAGGQFGDEVEAAHLLGEAASGGVDFHEALAE